MQILSRFPSCMCTVPSWCLLLSSDRTPLMGNNPSLELWGYPQAWILCVHSAVHSLCLLPCRREEASSCDAEGNAALHVKYIPAAHCAGAVHGARLPSRCEMQNKPASTSACSCGEMKCPLSQQAWPCCPWGGLAVARTALSWPCPKCRARAPEALWAHPDEGDGLCFFRSTDGELPSSDGSYLS